MDNQKLIDAVLSQIVKDVESGDVTAIEELIRTVEHDRLVLFLPEDQWINHPKEELLIQAKRSTMIGRLPHIRLR